MEIKKIMLKFSNQKAEEYQIKTHKQKEINYSISIHQNNKNHNQIQLKHFYPPFFVNHSP